MLRFSRKTNNVFQPAIRWFCTNTFIIDNPQSHSVIISAVNAIENHGFAIIPRYFTPSSLELLAKPLDEHSKRVTNALTEKKIQLGIGSANGFHEVCLRSPGRFDIPLGFRNFSDYQLAPLEDIVSKILGESYEEAFCGLIYSIPGSPAQEWHCDSPHVSRDHAPANMLHCLVALHDVSVEMGPTEFVPNSHRETNHFSNPDIDLNIVYQSPENAQFVNRAPFNMDLPAGSLVVFDDRILHRGLGNNTNSDRRMAYFSFKREGYVADTHFEATRSLFGVESPPKEDFGMLVRSQFPALEAYGDSIFADGASGSQVHQSVITAMKDQLTFGSANIGGYYPTSARAQKIVAGARTAAADFLNCDSSEITFGHNMTTLAFHLGNSIKKDLRPGDNFILSELDHHANVGAWNVSSFPGVETRWIPATSEGTLDLDALEKIIDSKSRLVCLGAASNGLGTINDVKRACKIARNHGAYSFVDAVHYAPHGLIDVRDIGCDFLACSAYKFFGPHVGILYGRGEIMQRLTPQQIGPATTSLPCSYSYDISKWELGTQNYEGLAGTTAAIDYLATLGQMFGSAPCDSSRRTRLEAGWAMIELHETKLKRAFLQGASVIKGLKVFGTIDEEHINWRTATFAISKEGYSPDELTKALCERNIWCTSGNHYATFWEKSFGLSNEEGATRLGFLHYNTEKDVQKILQVLESL